MTLLWHTGWNVVIAFAVVVTVPGLLVLLNAGVVMAAVVILIVWREGYATHPSAAFLKCGHKTERPLKTASMISCGVYECSGFKERSTRKERGENRKETVASGMAGLQ